MLNMGLTFFFFWLFICRTIGRRLEKEMQYKYLDADDFHSELNKGLCVYGYAQGLILSVFLFLFSHVLFSSYFFQNNRKNANGNPTHR